MKKKGNNTKDKMSIRKLLTIIFVIIFTISLFVIIITKNKLNSYDYIPITFLAVFVISLVVYFSLIPDDDFLHKQNTYKKEKNDIVKEAKVKRDIWQKSAIIWQITHYTLQGLTAVFLGIIIYLTSGNKNSDSVLLYSILSFGVMFISMIFNPNKTSMAYSQSYVDIYSVLQLYDAGEADYEQIAKTLSICEQRICDNTH